MVVTTQFRFFVGANYGVDFKKNLLTGFKNHYGVDLKKSSPVKPGFEGSPSREKVSSTYENRGSGLTPTNLVF
jgi:hypothetical protein